MKRRVCAAFLVILLVLPWCVTGCRGTVTGSGEMTNWELAHTDFTDIEISHGFDVEIIRDDEFSISLDIDRVLFEHLVAEQRGDTLRIGLENNVYLDTTQKARITMPEIRKLELSGASKVTLTGFSSWNSLEVKASGGSALTLYGIEAGDVKCELSGGSRIVGDLIMNDGDFSLSGASVMMLEGSGIHLKLRASGVSVVVFDTLRVLTADISLGTSSTASVNVSQRMDIDLSGATELDYYGSPKLGDINVSGGSTVTQK